MAFCNSCGAALTAGTRFCNKCGSPILASAPMGTSPSPPTPAPTGFTPVTTPSPAPGTIPAPAPTGGSSALKVVLIVVGVIFLIGILGVASFGFFVHKMIKSARVHQDGNNVKVETPFGNVETSKDSGEAVKDLGVDVYPGAQATKDGASTVTFGGIHTVAATFESSDAVDKICTFYKTKFPNAMVTTSGDNRCTIISSDKNNMVTINIESDGSQSKLQITNVNKGSSSN